MFCNNCGAKLHKDSIYCHKCGHKVNNDIDSNYDQITFDDLGSDSNNDQDIYEKSYDEENIDKILEKEQELLEKNQIDILDEIDQEDEYKLIDKVKDFFIQGEKKLPDTEDKVLDINNLVTMDSGDPTLISKEETLNLHSTDSGDDGETIVYSKKTIQSLIDEEETKESADDSAEPSIDQLLDLGDIDIRTEQKTEKTPVPPSTPSKVGATLSKYTKEFLKSVKEFFIPFQNSAETEDVEGIEEDQSPEITIQDNETTDDTAPLIFTDEERKLLDDALKQQNKKHKLKYYFTKYNKKIAPSVRKLLDMGANSRIPILLVSLILATMSLWFNIKNPRIYIPLGIIKLFVTFVIINISTSSAFKALRVKLSGSLKSFFVISQMLIYHLLDTIFIRATLIKGATTEAIIHGMSPNIFSFVIMLILGLGLVVLNFQHINDEKTILPFYGSYVVVSMTLIGLIILLESILLSVFGSLIASYMI